VTPKKFSFPGNLPENWFSDDWNFPKNKGRKLKQALVEQSYILNQAISKNKCDMSKNADLMIDSIKFAINSTIFSGFLFFIYATWVIFIPDDLFLNCCGEIPLLR
jgi:hypothetical protein